MAATNKLQKFFTLIALGGVSYLISFFVFPADNFSIQQSTFSISGKCTLKNWEIISKAAWGEGEITMDNNKIPKVNSFKIIIPANSFESESYTMNNHAKEALKTKKNPNIVFILKKIEQMVVQGDKTRMRISGDLTVAGITKPITLNANVSPSDNGLLFQGKHALKMSDFEIEPPTFILGGIKTQDDVMVSFRVYVKPSGQTL